MRPIATGFLLILCASVGFAEEKEVCLADPALYKHDGIYYLFGTEPPPQQGFRIYASSDLQGWYVPKTAYEDGYVLKAGERVFGTEGFWAP